jgi:hypothetical protein
MPNTCGVSMSMLHAMSMLHVHLHVACPYPCCLSMSMLHAQYMLRVHVYTPCLCLCMSTSLLHVSVHAVD